jgi:hypothetical protein
MQTESAEPIKRRYPAFATSMDAGAERIAIDAERIVILLGTDPKGRPLELSLELSWTAKAGRLFISAIKEPFPEPKDEEPYPLLRMESPAFVDLEGQLEPVDNLGEVWIEYED